MVSPNTRVVILQNLAAIDILAWNRIVEADQFYLSYGWLQAAHREFAARTSYLLAYREDDLVGALPLHSVRYDPNPLYQPRRYQDLFGFAGDVLIGGALRGYRNDIVVDQRLLPNQQADVIRILVSAALTHACRLGALGVVFPYLTGQGLARLGSTRPLATFVDTAEAELIEPDGIAKYLGQLSRDRRAMARREMRVFARAGWAVTPAPLAEHVGVVARLVANVQRKYGLVANERTIERELSMQERNVGAHAVLLLARSADDVIGGCALSYAWRSHLYARLVGLAYESVGEAYEYFNLLFYGQIQHMEQRAIDCFHLGIGSLFAKVLRGAVLLPLWTAFLPVPGQPIPRPDPVRPELADVLRQAARVPGALRTDDWPFAALV